MKCYFYMYLFFIAMVAPEICLATPTNVNNMKKEIIPINSMEFTVRLWSRFLRNATLKEIGKDIENHHKGNSAVAITFNDVNKEEKLAGIYYYNYFPDFHPNIKIYSSFFEDKSKQHLYWIIVEHRPPFKFDFFLYILSYPFKEIGIYPDFISTPINAWPQSNVPVAKFRFNSNGYGDFLSDDISFDYDSMDGILISELRDKRGSNAIRISYDLNKKHWSYTPLKATPPKSAQRINNDKSKTFRRGWFDPLPPEELERRKREFQASQPLKELFSATELKVLFTEPDYSKITDPLKLAQTYDWFGKYPEALAVLEKADGAEAKFELGCFLKHGRPGVHADKRTANKLFSEIAFTIASGDRTFSPEDYCLAGRACREYVPENWTETTRWKKRASQFFQKAIEQGYRPAYYYSQYYERHSSDCNLIELVKALPSDNPEINAFIATVAATNPHLKQYRDRAQNLAAVKAAVEARSNVAQCALGMLYLAFETTPDAFLRHNPEKARFWLQRAAERGDTDAIQILRNDSRLNMPNQLQKKK